MTKTAAKSKQEDVVDIYSNQDYLHKNPSWHVEDSPWKAKQVQTILNKNKITPKTIAEIGCGAGEILISLSDHYKDASFYGYEVSTDAHEMCKPKATDKLSFFLADMGGEDVHYDVSLCMDVFEHVEDYIGFLRRLKDKADYHVFHIPLDISMNTLFRNGMIKTRVDAGHLHYYTAETAIATLEDVGYEIIDSFHTAPFASDGVADKTFKAKLARWPRALLYKISPNFLSKTLGGCPLLVLAKPKSS